MKYTIVMKNGYTFVSEFDEYIDVINSFRAQIEPKKEINIITSNGIIFNANEIAVIHPTEESEG